MRPTRTSISDWSNNPFTELVRNWGLQCFKIDSQIIIKPTKVISRVRRDTRSPTIKACTETISGSASCREQVKNVHCSLLWFDIGQNGSSHGVGLWRYHPNPWPACVR